LTDNIATVSHADEGGDAHVATVVLDNQRKLNTLNPDLIKSATAALRGLASIDSLRAVVLTGAGEKSFIGGADVKHMATLDKAGGRAFISSLHELCQAVLEIPVPVIGRVNGYTLGAGLEVAACCDWRIASDNAQFGMPEVQIGIPSVIEAVRMPLLIGWGNTRELLMTGRWIDAAEAQSMGFLEKVVTASDLDAAVNESLKYVTEAGPLAIRNQKALVNSWEKTALAEASRASIDSFAAAYDTDEPTRLMQGFANRKK